jgi:ribonuclease-3
MKDLKEFYKKFHIHPKNKEYYEMAFTHSSFNSDAKTHHHDYERLEFMGDSVLGFVIASLLFRLHPEMREGDMTKAKATLVQSKALADYARKLGYPEFIRAGRSLSLEEAASNQSILEDIFEAVIGAVYLDLGIKFVIKFIENIFYDDVKNFVMEEVKDYKSQLQEAVQSEKRGGLFYKVTGEKGPQHDKTFYIEVCLGDIILGKGEGHSKKEAEQDAAKDALRKKAMI